MLYMHMHTHTHTHTKVLSGELELSSDTAARAGKDKKAEGGARGPLGHSGE